MALLVMTRRTGEKIEATMPDGRVIRAIVLECGGGRVRLGWEAPADVRLRTGKVEDEQAADVPQPALPFPGSAVVATAE